MILNLIKEIYHKYSDKKIFVILNDVYMNGSLIGNLMAAHRLKTMKKNFKTHELPIRVLFVCPQINTWGKVKRVFERMLEDERFYVNVVALDLPDEKDTGRTYRFLFRLYHDSVINALDRESALFDIEAWKPDYVFLCNSYDQYVPKRYRSGYISRFSKICYVNYGYEFSKTTFKVTFEKKFFRNLYLFFAENTYTAEYNRKRFRRAHESEEMKTVDIGYPSFEDFWVKKTEKTDEKFTIVWTPRWTEDKNLGGSSFFKYKDKVLSFSLANEDMKLVFRPHPMTFQHFVSIGKISEEDVQEYLSYFAGNNNREYDNKGDYAETFWKSDVLLTDISSVMIEYFLTGKPIIYCETGAEFNPAFEKMYESLYVVNSWEEAERVLIQLSRGIDPLKELRESAREELLGNDFASISKRFLDVIYDDFRNNENWEKEVNAP